MANFTEANTFTETVPLVEITDIVLGGSETSGPNKIGKPLVDRTRWLKDKVDTLLAAVNGTSILERAYPVGSIYTNLTNSANPSTYLEFGVWAAISGRVLVGFDASQTEFSPAGKLAGSKTHTLAPNEGAKHNHALWVTDQPTETTSDSLLTVPSAITGEIEGNHSYSFTNSGGQALVLSAPDTTQPHNNLQPYIVGYMWTRTA